MEKANPKRPASAGSSRPPARPATGKYARACVVLVVDDAKDSLEMYAAYFTHSGFHVLTAVDGAEGIVKALARRPDAIVMDLAMPRMDGFEATRRLKANPETKHIPIIVLTGNGLGGHAIATRAGCDAYLLKPCGLADLVGVVRSLIDVAGATARGD